MKNFYKKTLDFFLPTEQENNILQKLDGRYSEFSEMSPEERQFLNGLILRNQPKKLLELGVSAGGSSVIMLNSIKDIPESQLHSIDYTENWYLDSRKKTGWIVNEFYPNLAKKHIFHGGGLALEFMDKIGADIDFCLIDTMHVLPGELLDTLMVLPFLKENAIIVFHDANLHTAATKNKASEWAFVNNLIVSALHGKKILQENFVKNNSYCEFPNIAAIHLNAETKERIFELFNLLSIKWVYLPSQKEELEILEYFEKYYDSIFIEYMKNVFNYQRLNFKAEQLKPKGLKFKIKKIIRSILK
jgi:predicted O-methyltransferase YrrM